MSDESLSSVGIQNEPLMNDFQYFQGLGLDAASAAMLVDEGISRDLAGHDPSSVVPFVSAAVHHGLGDIAQRLIDAEGDPDLAWRRWGEEEEGLEAESDEDDDPSDDDT